MPTRRREERGSFRGALDELVPRLVHEPNRPKQSGKQPSDAAGSKHKPRCPEHLNQSLFEQAWRSQRQRQR